MLLGLLQGRPVERNTPLYSAILASGTFPNIGLAALRTRIFTHNIVVHGIRNAVLLIKKSTNRIII